jgi:threonyl-tRNA synthetase
MSSPVEHDALYRIRHSLAHVLATAVLEMRPDAKLAFGPPIDDGCYYDFMFSQPITAEDIGEITKKIRSVIGRREKFEHRTFSQRGTCPY